MDGLIELIFEQVPDEAVGRLMNDLLQGVDILELSHSELGRLDPKKANFDLMTLLEQEAEPLSLFVRTTTVTVEDVTIRSPMVRILRCGGVNEITVIFDRGDVDEAVRLNVGETLAAGAKAVASRANVSEYYCGFEPASDDKTRLFAKDKIGPLMTI
ncbi:hypothetical protein [Paludibacterium paludis]|uniref:Uncharacterized protein n=1 Tax=Paludibacterium paludis TaxID=1225769 RepID=A0A918UB29_9NEIS|nr:hypothetical protein [Paludibacterium paludis]GGY20378.1 hypothetical protein GCM10011289_24970 [Paludibacterium paludis]